MIAQALVLIASVLVSSTVIGCKTEQASAGQASPSSTAAAPGSATVKNGFDGMPPAGTKAKCPVMGTEFQVTKETQSSVYKGKTYVFCCNGCKPQFDANPEKYVGSS